MCTFALESTLLAKPKRIPFPQHSVTVDQTIEFELTENRVIQKKMSPFIASTRFGATKPQKIIIHSSNNSAIIIERNGIWDLTSFSSSNKIIEFRGNARLILYPGAKIIGNSGILKFFENSRMLIQ
jgi:hypothetical protein